MLHPINRSDLPALIQLNALARLTIAFGLQQEDHCSPETIRLNFIHFFQAQGYPEIGAWLWRKPEAIKNPLIQLLAIPLQNKAAILAAYDADMQLEACFQAGHFFTTALPEQVQPALTLVKAMLLRFYTHILYDGIDGIHVSSQESLNRQVILRQFEIAQKPLRLKVCPGCDGQPPPLTTIYHAELDHFFPKSKYPLLAIHPLNLLPLCTDCNQEFKADRDAISDPHPDVADVSTLEHIFHPYLRPARDEIDIVVVRNPGTQRPEFKLLPKQDNVVGHARIKSLNYALQLSARWNGELEREQIQEEFERLLLHGTQEERDDQAEAFALTEGRFGTQLCYTLSTLKHSQGRIANSLATYAYAQWVQSDSEAFREWLEICQGKALS